MLLERLRAMFQLVSLPTLRNWTGSLFPLILHGNSSFHLPLFEFVLCDRTENLVKILTKQGYCFFPDAGRETVRDAKQTKVRPTCSQLKTSSLFALNGFRCLEVLFSRVSTSTVPEKFTTPPSVAL